MAKKRKRKKSKKIKKKLKIRRKKKVKKLKSEKSSELIFKVTKKWSKNAYVNRAKYEKKYKLSIKNNEDFWKKEGKRIDWIKPYTKIKDVKYSKTDVKIKWYYDGTLNASVNCIDRHLENKKINLQLFGWVMTQKYQNRLVTKNSIEMFVRLQTV